MPTIQGQISLADTDTNVLTVGANEIIEVFQIELHSVSESPQVIQMYFVPNNSGAIGTPDVTNEKEGIDLPGGESLTIVSPKAPWVFKNQNDSIFLKTGLASSLNYFITYSVNGEL